MDAYRRYGSPSSAPAINSTHRRASGASGSASGVIENQGRTESLPSPLLSTATATAAMPYTAATKLGQTYLPPLHADRYGKPSLPSLPPMTHMHGHGLDRQDRHAYPAEYSYPQGPAPPHHPPQRYDADRPYDYRSRDYRADEYRRDQPGHGHAGAPAYPATAVAAGYPSALGLHAARRVADMERTSPANVPTKRGRDDESDSGSDDDRKEDKSKLEVKREKNRVKQRNLRLRRANHISDLEGQVATLTDERAGLQQRMSDLERKSANVERYVSDLEAILRESGFERELFSLQAAWKGGEYTGRDAAGMPSGSIESRMRPPPRPLSLKTGLGSYTASSLSPVKDDRSVSLPHGLGISEPSVPRRTSTGSSPWVDSPIKGLTPANNSEPAPSPRSLRIEDLLSPSSSGQGFREDLQPNPGDSKNGYEGAGPPLKAEMPDFVPLNISFTPEPWLMGSWLTRGLPQELGDPLAAWTATSSESGADLITVEDATSFGDPTDPSKFSTLERRRSSQVHPCVHVARNMLRTIITDSHLPPGDWSVESLEPLHQQVILSALSQLGDPALHNELVRHQVSSLPPGFVKVLLEYQLDPNHEIRLLLMPIAILRARIIQFITKDHLDFDVTTFITHVLADARVFGDVADANAWEMSQTFWDVWGGWFPLARGFCASLASHRRRYGNVGSTPMEIVMGEEQPNARMTCLVGRPEGWTMPAAVVNESEGKTADSE